MAAQTILKKISDLELELQKLKLEAYLSLPKKRRAASIYKEQTLLKAARSIRDQIWRKRYAKKIKSLY